MKDDHEPIREHLKKYYPEATDEELEEMSRTLERLLNLLIGPPSS